jgi:fumigallin biosynthesis monooxygenase-like protein
MAHVIPGRFTARTDESFVVFIIGMRINRPLAIRKWLPTVRAMGPMLRELYRHPEKGFLGGEFFLYWRGPALVQYWRSFEDLERFARNPDDPHLPAWRRFNRSVGSDGTVGIFHETFIVKRGNYEAVYGNMPVFGLAKATEHVRAVGGRETARRRLMRGENDPAVPSPE